MPKIKKNDDKIGNDSMPKIIARATGAMRGWAKAHATGSKYTITLKRASTEDSERETQIQDAITDLLHLLWACPLVRDEDLVEEYLETAFRNFAEEVTEYDMVPRPETKTGPFSSAGSATQLTEEERES